MSRFRTPINTYYPLSCHPLFIRSRWYNIRRERRLDASPLCHKRDILANIYYSRNHHCHRHVSSFAVMLTILANFLPGWLKRDSGGAWKIVNASWFGRFSVSAVLLVRVDFFRNFNNFNQKVCSSGVSCRPQIDSNATLLFVSTRISFPFNLEICNYSRDNICYRFFFFRFFDISSIIFSFYYLIRDWLFCSKKKRRK